MQRLLPIAYTEKTQGILIIDSYIFNIGSALSLSLSHTHFLILSLFWVHASSRDRIAGNLRAVSYRYYPSGSLWDKDKLIR